jgi:hypothetical protein
VALPVKTTAEDVRGIVRYLKTKPTGATLAEAKAVDRRIVDGRKLAAYKTWGIVSRDGDRLKLTDRGWLMARQPEREAEAFAHVADSIRPYRSVLEWLNHQDADAVTAVDVAVHWHEHHKDAVGAEATDSTLRENAVCFFNVAEAAGFGKMVIGRGGNPTRFEADPAKLRLHIEAGPSAPPWQDGEVEEDEPAADEPPPDEPKSPPTDPPPREALQGLKVFISHGKNASIVEQIQTMLGLADFDSEVAVAEESTAIPVPDKVLDAMRRCQAGIIAVTVEEGRKDDQGNYVLNENVLIEIGAAFVLYDRRVVLLWDKRLSVPSNLQGLYRCEFEGDELSWTAGMKLMKAIQNFKQSPSKPA